MTGTVIFPFQIETAALGFVLGVRVQRIPKKKNQSFGLVLFLEAPPRLELGNRGFAVRCLTTWLWRRILEKRAF